MGTTAESRTAYLEKMRYRSYFIWLQKAVGKLYGISEPITAENWDMISEQIHKAHQNPSFRLDLFFLGYKKGLLSRQSAFALSAAFGMTGVWLAFPAAEFVTIFIIVRVLRQLKL